MDHNVVVVFRKPQQIVMEERLRPASQPGELLIKTRRSLVSTGTELTILSGEFPAQSAWAQYGVYPFDAGYSNVGEVIDVGPDVDQSWIGKRVAIGQPHARYVVEAPDATRVVPPGLSDEEATFFALAEFVMNGVRRAQVQYGEAVVVYGAGLLGQLVARVCRICGARPVIVVDVAAQRLELLPSDKAVVPLNPTSTGVVAEVQELTRGRMADVVFEVTGNPDLIPDEFAVLRRQGRFVVLSSPRGPTSFDFHDLCNWISATIIGAHGSSHPSHATLDNPWTRKRHGELFFDLVADGELEIGSLISHRGPYFQAPDLYNMLLQDRSQAMGVILDWTTT